MITVADATLTQNLDSKARNLEIRKNVLTKFLWEQKQAAEATSPPAKAPVGRLSIPPQQARHDATAPGNPKITRIPNFRVISDLAS